MVDSDEDRATVDELEGRWLDELGETRAPWDEAWLCGRADGFATFPRSRQIKLSRIRVRPELRRRGLGNAGWARFREHYGVALEAWQPSALMTAAMAHAEGV